MKKTTKDSKSNQARIKDLTAKKDVKGGTVPRLSDKNGNVAGAGGKIPVL